MGWAAIIPAALSAVSSISKMASPSGGGQQQTQGGRGMMPMNPFPENHPDGGKKQPSILDLFNGMNPQQGGQPPQPGGAQSNFMVPGGGKPLSVVDAFLPGGTSPSVFNPIQDPLQAGLGGLLKGIFK